MIRAEPFPKARVPEIELWVNFGPKQIGKFMSECLVLGFLDENGAVVLIHPDNRIADGERLF